MQQCALDNGMDRPITAQTIQSDFYVDDCFTRADTPGEAILLGQDLDIVLRKGGFEMTK